MQVTISDRGRTINLSAQSIQVGGSVDLHFKSATESMDAFRKLCEMNIRCYHAGENAPCGPYITFYQSENRDAKFSFQ